MSDKTFKIDAEGDTVYVMDNTHYCENVKAVVLFPESACICGDELVYTESNLQARLTQVKAEAYRRCAAEIFWNWVDKLPNDTAFQVQVTIEGWANDAERPQTASAGEEER